MDKEFCLLDEPWIKVLDEQNVTREVSLIDIFTNAHRYKRLAGETVTQDAAILRLLLAVAITVFYRYRADGCQDCVLEYDDPEEEILNRWSEYWDSGAFNANVFQEYLETYRERFYLFHPETPFWQVADLEDGLSYTIINLYGNIKESKNQGTKHHFHMTDGKYVENISFAETARWLVFNNAYSKTIKYKDGKSLKNAKIGRVGELGLIVADSDNMYKLLLLNLCALKNGEFAWKEPRPIWEVEYKTEVGHEIIAPDNLPELYTIQSRRIRLNMSNSKIIGYMATCGNFYSKENDPTEQMTLLEYDKNNDIVPRKHNMNMEVWKEFTSLLPIIDNIKAGLVFWLERLTEESLIENRIITFQMIGLKYDKDYRFIYENEINQSLSLSLGLLNSVGEVWVGLITDQINKCKEVAKKNFYEFAHKLALHLYKDDKTVKFKTEKIKEILEVEYYFKIDKAFPEWLISIEPSSSKRDIKEREWQIISSQTAEAIVRNYIASLSPQFTMAGAKAFVVFKKELYKIYPNNLGEGGE